MRNFIIILLLTVTNVSGQLFNGSSYYKGKIYTQNDTIDCYLELTDNYSGQIKYKLDKEDKNVLKVQASDVMHIKTISSYYDRISYDDLSFLMERGCVGEICLYKRTTATLNAQMYNSGTGTFIGGGSSESAQLYIVKNGKTIKVRKRKLHETLKQLMSDHKNIHGDIDKLKYRDMLFESDIERLIRQYNSWFKYVKKSGNNPHS